MKKRFFLALILAAACISTAYSHEIEHNWKDALWIGSPWDGEQFNPAENFPAPELFRNITVEKKVRSATVSISGLGLFELYVNGEKTGDDVLTPNETSYTHRPNLVNRQPIPTDDSHFAGFRVNYMVYDITDQLKRGENVISVILGNGFFSCGSVRWVEPYGTPRMICHIELKYADGTCGDIVSGTDWKVRKTHIVSNDMYMGETFDLTSDVESEFSAVEKKAPDGKLVKQTSPSDKVKETFKPVEITRLEDGRWEVDFGECITGWIKMKNFSLGKGERIEIEFPAECPGYNGSEIFIGDGSEVREYAPKFTWFTFRKAIISGWPGKLGKNSLEAQAVYSDVEQTGHFECSNPLFNKLNDLWCRTQKDNMHMGVATDCPHREKGPYTGDGQVSCVTVMHNFDVRDFYRKWFADMRDCQDTLTGYVPNGAPWHPGCGGGLAWGAAMIIMPWEHYVHYGDPEILRENYKAMQGQMRFMMSWKEENGLINLKTPLEWQNLGEWSISYNMPERKLVFTYFCFKCASMMQNAAGVLGLPGDEEEYGRIKDELWEAFHREFYDRERKTYGEMDGANIFALAMGVPEDRLEDVRQTVRNEIESNGFHINTGIFGTQLFFETLAENGMNDLAFKVMNSRTQPGFGWMVENGADTIWEQWDGGNSRNHPMFGGAFCWFYRKLAGLECEKPGYSGILFRPMPVGDVTYASYETMTPSGKAAVKWKIRKSLKGEKLTVVMTVPEGCEARYEMPDGTKGMIKGNKEKIKVWNFRQE